jgi:hypothetical protein
MKLRIKSISSKNLTIIFSILAMLLIAPTKYFEVFPQVQDSTSRDERLDEAESEYKAGHWAESIDLINECLAKQDLSETEKGRAYRQLGLVYIAIELEKEANDAVKNLLIMVPNYKIDPDRDPPQLKKMIDDVSEKVKPTITNITPDNVDAESEQVTLTVNGSDFVYGSVVRFNSVEKVSTYISPSQITAVIPSSDLMKAGENDITVFSPIHGGKISNIMKFNVNEPSNALTWILIGGGAAVAAVVAIVALGGGGDETTDDPGNFPSPPGRP